MAVDMQTRLSARDPAAGSKPVMMQRWRDLLFLHWEVPAAAIRETLPAGLHVDTFEGKAYLGMVPFFMERVRPPSLPALPWISFFMELNLRTYVYDEAGLPGVWFYSLDANQALAVEVARRWYHLPYQHARMSANRGEKIDFRCRRKAARIEARFVYPPIQQGHPARQGSLEFFLLERYRLFSYDARKGRLYRGQVQHAPYEYQLCSPDAWSSAPFAWNGMAAIEGTSGEPVHSAVAKSVDVTAFAIEPAVPATSSSS